MDASDIHAAIVKVSEKLDDLVWSPRQTDVEREIRIKISDTLKMIADEIHHLNMQRRKK